MKTKLAGNKTAFTSHLKDAKIARENFVAQKSGSVLKIVKNDQCLTFLTAPKAEKNSTLLQCCKDVKISAEKFIEKRGNPISEDYFIPTEFSNFDDLVEGMALFSIDVKSCYWRSAYLLDIISLETYLKYLPNKLDRNKAIGCLKRKTESIYYQSGVELRREVKENELGLINTYIKSYIYDIFLEAKEKFELYHYHTDEFWIGIGMAGELDAFLKSKGFRTTCKIFKVIEIKDNGVSVFFPKEKIVKFVRKKKENGTKVLRKIGNATT
jgi:hypothetical protein